MWHEGAHQVLWASSTGSFEIKNQRRTIKVVHGFMESPYHDTGNAIFDVKSYLNHAWLMWKQKNDVVDNISKIKQLIEKEQKINFLGKTANSGIKKIVNFVQER